MVQIQTRCDFQAFQQVGSSDICGPKRVADKFVQERGSVYQQEKVENPVCSGINNVLLEQRAN